jgi:hypothetical protein
MLFQFVILVTIGVYFWILSILRFPFKSLKPRWKAMKNAIFWNFTLRTFLEGYLPLSN